MRLTTTRSGVENKEVVIHIFVHFHNTCLICASVAVVGCREYSHDMLIMTPVEAIHDKLMCT